MKKRILSVLFILFLSATSLFFCNENSNKVANTSTKVTKEEKESKPKSTTKKEVASQNQESNSSKTTSQSQDEPTPETSSNAATEPSVTDQTESTETSVTGPAENTETAQPSTPSMSAAEYNQLVAGQMVDLAAIEARTAQENQQIFESTGTMPYYIDSAYARPTYRRMTCNYGYRIHPISGVEHLHNGIDFAVPLGENIYAAQSGRVVAAATSPIMGNYIVLYHGDGLFSIYMHASAFYVSTGQVVQAGAPIAAAGSTGLSTGNHLHFSIRRNGVFENPWNYIP